MPAIPPASARGLLCPASANNDFRQPGISMGKTASRRDECNEPSARSLRMGDVRAPIAKSAIAASTAPKPGTVWPGGSNWLPATQHWGTRNPEFHGCGKCRWYPKGCLGCRKAGQTYTPRVAEIPLRPGDVRLPEAGSDGTSKIQLKELEQDMLDLHRRLLVVSGSQQSDPCGFGVIASPHRPKLRAGEILRDPSVLYVSRPAAYAAVHLPQFHAVEVDGKGRIGYWRLREDAFGHCSLTFYINDSSMSGTTPNCFYHTKRDRFSMEEYFCIKISADIEPGGELLAAYDVCKLSSVD